MTGDTRRGRKPLWPQSTAKHVGLMLVAAIALTAAVGFGLWSALGRPQLAVTALDAKERLEALKVVLALVGGVGAVFFLTIAYRKQRNGEGAEQREEVKLFTDRFSTAAGLLGHEHAATRMAGIHAMAQLADDSPEREDRQQCIDALCSYLRLPFEPDPASPQHRYGEQVVRDAVARVIRDHLRGFTAQSWSSHKFNLAGATFESLDFTGVRLEPSGHITFHKAIFRNGNHHFTDLKIDDGRIWFTGVEFHGSLVSFKRAQINVRTHGVVSFNGARFLGGEMTFAGAVDDGGLTFANATFGATRIDWGALTSPAEFPSSTAPQPRQAISTADESIDSQQQ